MRAEGNRERKKSLTYGGPLAVTATGDALVSGDSFNLTVQDGHGLPQTMAVNVTVGNSDGLSPNLISAELVGPDFVVKFAGIPFYTYTVETNSVASGPGWTKWGNVTATGTGLLQVVDPVGNASLFYRTVYPSY